MVVLSGADYSGGVSPETPGWVRDAVFYQVFPDRFARSARVPKPANLEPWDSPPTAHGFKGGDLLGVAEKLDDLKDLGVTALYLNPVFASAANHRYHTWDYHQVDPLLGGDAALRELLDAAHARGMRVILDGVFNHVGRGFFAFHHVLENGADSPYLDWFLLDLERLRAGKPLGAYAEPKLLRRGRKPKPAFEELGYAAWWDVPALPKLDTRTPAVREYLWDVAERWIRFGIDGWRLDVPSEIDDDEFWRELRRRVKRANPEAYLVGEIWYDARRWLAGDQFDATMNYPLAKAALGFFVRDLDLDAIRVRRRLPRRPAARRRGLRRRGRAGPRPLRPRRPRRPAEPPRQPRHAPLPHRLRERPRRPRDGVPLPLHLPGRPVRLLRRRDRPRRRRRPRLPPRLPLGRVVVGPRPARAREAARGAPARPPRAPAGLLPDRSSPKAGSSRTCATTTEGRRRRRLQRLPRGAAGRPPRRERRARSSSTRRPARSSR